MGRLPLVWSQAHQKAWVTLCGTCRITGQHRSIKRTHISLRLTSRLFKFSQNNTYLKFDQLNVRFSVGHKRRVQVIFWSKTTPQSADKKQHKMIKQLHVSGFARCLTIKDQKLGGQIKQLNVAKARQHQLKCCWMTDCVVNLASRVSSCQTSYRGYQTGVSCPVSKPGR